MLDQETLDSVVGNPRTQIIYSKLYDLYHDHKFFELTNIIIDKDDKALNDFLQQHEGQILQDCKDEDMNNDSDSSMDSDNNSSIDSDISVPREDKINQYVLDHIFGIVCELYQEDKLSVLLRYFIRWRPSFFNQEYLINIHFIMNTNNYSLMAEAVNTHIDIRSKQSYSPERTTKNRLLFTEHHKYRTLLSVEDIEKDSYLKHKLHYFLRYHMLLSYDSHAHQLVDRYRFDNDLPDIETPREFSEFLDDTNFDPNFFQHMFFGQFDMPSTPIINLYIFRDLSKAASTIRLIQLAKDLINPCAIDYIGKTPLICATKVYTMQKVAVELLVAFGTALNLNAQDYDRGNTALHYACAGGQLETVQYLILHHQNDINFSIKNNSGQTAFEMLDIDESEFRVISEEAWINPDRDAACGWNIDDDNLEESERYGESLLDHVIKQRAKIKRYLQDFPLIKFQ